MTFYAVGRCSRHIHGRTRTRTRKFHTVLTKYKRLVLQWFPSTGSVGSFGVVLNAVCVCSRAIFDSGLFTVDRLIQRIEAHKIVEVQ